MGGGEKEEEEAEVEGGTKEEEEEKEGRGGEEDRACLRGGWRGEGTKEVEVEEEDDCLGRVFDFGGVVGGDVSQLYKRIIINGNNK